MTGQLPQEPTAWMTFLSACAGVATPGALFGLFIWRKVHTAMTAYKAGDADVRGELDAAAKGLAARITDLAANSVRDIEAHAQQFKTEHRALEDDTDRRFDKVHGRLDGLVAGMARRDDLSRVEGKIDELLSRLATAGR